MLKRDVMIGEIHVHMWIEDQGSQAYGSTTRVMERTARDEGEQHECGC
jgi:hypothetical protein